MSCHVESTTWPHGLKIEPQPHDSNDAPQLCTTTTRERIRLWAMCVPELEKVDAQAKAAETTDEDEINDDRMGLHQRSGGAERLALAYHERAGAGTHHE